MILNGNLLVLQGRLQGVGGGFPDLVGADVLLGLGRQLDREILEPEGLVRLEDQVDDADDLRLDLGRHAVDMGIVLGELADPEQAVHHAAGLVPVHHAELGHAQRQLAIRVLGGLVEQAAAGAVHRLDRIADLVDLGEVHVLFVVVPVAAAVPELLVENDRGPDLLVPVLAVHLPHEIDISFQMIMPLGCMKAKPGPISLKLNRSSCLPRTR